MHKIGLNITFIAGILYVVYADAGQTSCRGCVAVSELAERNWGGIDRCADVENEP